jgi:hypothetical protein
MSTFSAPLGTPPGSPSLAPVPLARCGPRGEDPYKAQREELRKEAREGFPCPVNQHACFYFGASEWVFCRMCEWERGHVEGRALGLLAPFGGTLDQHKADIKTGNTIKVKREDLILIFKERKVFITRFEEYDWQTCGDGLLTRTQVHNLLMKYGAPMDCLGDVVWAELQSRFPAESPPVGSSLTPEERAYWEASGWR